MEKSVILDALGERALLMPALVHRALDANARAKFYFSLLQLARAHADAPAQPQPDLAAERKACGLDDGLDDVVAQSLLDPHGEYRIPAFGAIVGHALDEAATMIAPLRTANPDMGATFERRLDAVRTRLGFIRDGVASCDEIAALTSSQREADSAHLIVFDAHKALNALEAELATDVIEGAQVYGLSEADRPLVAAFMRGLTRTAALKLDHPGLSTTATRSSDRLVIENDVGTTASHVLVLSIEGMIAKITTTDVHHQRIEFFQRMLEGEHVAWESTCPRGAAIDEDGVFYLSIGTFAAKDAADLARFLDHVGSRLVFLIDWNRARKQLRTFIPKEQAIAVLDSAAGEDVGHRALLELGGGALIFEAMASVIRTPLRFGERLDDVIGVEAACSFMRFALAEASTGLREGRSRQLIAERVRAELSKHFRGAGDRLLGPVLEHARFVAELACIVRDGLGSMGASEEAVLRAKKAEHDADSAVGTMRDLAERIPGAGPICRVIEAADDAADAVEEAAFLLGLLRPLQCSEALRATLAALGESVANAADSYAVAVDVARRSELHALLDAVDAIVAIEHHTDEIERRATSEMVSDPMVDPKLLYVLAGVARLVEQAVDAITHASLCLRDHVMSK